MHHLHRNVFVLHDSYQVYANFSVLLFFYYYLESYDTYIVLHVLRNILQF